MVDVQDNPMPIQLQNLFDNLFKQLNQAETDAQQAQLKTQIIKEMAEATNLTSAYICQWFPQTGQSMVTTEYISDHANHLERESDLGEYIVEDLSSFFGRGLIDGNPNPDTANVFNLPLYDTDRRHYLEYGACSICMARVWANNVIWGYLEMWESRYEREFTQQDKAIFHYVADQFGNYYTTSP